MPEEHESIDPELTRWVSAKFKKDTQVRITAEGRNKGKVGTVVHTWSDTAAGNRHYNIELPDGTISPNPEDALDLNKE